MKNKNKNVINAINLFLNKEILGNLSKDDIYKYIDDPNLVEKKIAQCEVDEIVDLSKLIFDLVYN